MLALLALLKMPEFNFKRSTNVTKLVGKMEKKSSMEQRSLLNLIESKIWLFPRSRSPAYFSVDDDDDEVFREWNYVSCNFLIFPNAVRKIKSVAYIRRHLAEVECEGEEDFWRWNFRLLLLIISLYFRSSLPFPHQWLVQWFVSRRRLNLVRVQTLWIRLPFSTWPKASHHISGNFSV